MEVILLEDTTNLGHLGEQVSVKAGFARNYLLPYGKAVAATKANIVKVELRRAELEAAAEKVRSAAEVRAKALKDLSITVLVKVDEEGNLYGSVGTPELVEKISAAAGVAIEKQEVKLPEGTLHELGEFDIAVQLHSDITEHVKVTVAAE